MDFTKIEYLKEINQKIDLQRSNKWMDINHVADYTSLSPSTIRRAILRGELKVSKKTGKLLFKQIWIDEFLEG